MGTEASSLDFAAVITILVYVAVWVYCFIFVFLKGKSRKQKFADRAREQGHYVTGESIEAKFIRGSRRPIGSDHSHIRPHRWKVTYRYVVRGMKYKKKLELHGGDCYVSRTYPRKVTVCYDPRNPKKAVCLEELSGVNEAGCLVTAIVPFVIAFLTYRALVWLF